MKSITLFSVIFLMTGCATYHPPIVVKNTPYVTMDAPTKTLRTPTVTKINHAQPTNLNIQAPEYNRELRASSREFDHYANAYESAYRSDRTAAAYHQAPGDYSVPSRQSRYANTREILRDPFAYMGSNSRTMSRNIYGHNSRGYDEEEQDDVVEYSPNEQDRTVQYIPVTVISVDEAPEQCDYKGVSNRGGRSGSTVPTWQDGRSYLGKHASRQYTTSGSYSQDLRCRAGGYIVTYIGEHPESGETFSGTVTTKRPPRGQLINIPFSF